VDSVLGGTYVDIALGKEDLAFAERMRSFFRTEIPAEIRAKGERGEHVSREDFVTTQQILNSHGLAVPHWPAAWGGQDWTALQRHIWAEEMALAHVPPPLAFNAAMVGPVIATFGSEELKQRFLPPTANLDIWWCQGFSEPNAGSDLASLTTRAVRDGDTYVINGQKTWTTLAQWADWIFCLVRTDPEAKKQLGISFVLVDMKTPGVTVRPIRLIDGGYEVNEVFFDDVRIPADQLVGEENKGWDYAKFLLGNERTGVAGTGIIKARIARLKKVAAETTSHGKPLLEDPLFRARLTRLEVETTALTMSVLRVLANEAKHPGKPDPVSSVLKLRGSELQQEASELLVDVLGPAALGYRETAKVSEGFAALPDGAADAMPTYFNWRKASIYSGSSEVQRSIIARAILKF
jgi:alkylation response protein AidB-like acyl-CoA dehydrogenase